LKPFPSAELSAQAALASLCESFMGSIKGIRNGIEMTTEGSNEEPVTNDILVSIATEYEKLLWMLNSHRSK